ncbi:hypothetical protein E2C01_042963 [Portunus trituberculatus]|uniref:Uncharacterized protein n=1 Tax=Portunus trituberculatus TaxID=210409 RepID=A0A5B7FW89_PORTR|nr:hypothetical protein [Portunus trituberculatus]
MGCGLKVWWWAGRRSGIRDRDAGCQQRWCGGNKASLWP